MVLRTALILCAALLWSSPAFPAENSLALEVWKSPTCGCCNKWVDHLEANGFDVKAHNTSSSMLGKIKREAGITDELASCHTAKIDGYVIEGHVPAADIKRLVAEHPDAVGLTVPNMPSGSPGMERADGKADAYEVLLVKKDGSAEVFARH